MSEIQTWSYDGTELAWLQAGLDLSRGSERQVEGIVVAELVPPGFAAYLRVFHRFEADDGSGRTRSWRSRAEESGRLFHAELCHWSLPNEETGCRWLAGTGQPDAVTRRALARCLARVTGNQSVFFAYDLAALLWGEPAPVVRRSSLAALDATGQNVSAEVGLGAGCGDVDGPEFWWPEDCSWVVTSDYDLVSTYVGCSAEAAALILADDEIEALPVTLRTRVDFHADEANRS